MFSFYYHVLLTNIIVYFKHLFGILQPQEFINNYPEYVLLRFGSMSLCKYTNPMQTSDLFSV